MAEKVGGISKPVGSKWGFPKVKGTFLGVPIIRTIIIGVYIGVPLFWETTKSLRMHIWDRSRLRLRTFSRLCYGFRCGVVGLGFRVKGLGLGV